MIHNTSPKVLLIQMRRDTGVRMFEYECFLKFTGLSKDSIFPFDAFARFEEISPELLRGFDAMIIAGSAESVLDESLPFLKPLEDLIRYCAEKSFPVLGICYGHQLIAKALGGTVVRDKSHEEIGTFLVELNDEGKKDPLFSQMPETFFAQCSHEYRVDSVPQGITVLAKSELCSNHAFRVDGKPMYGVQFHPDRGLEEMRKRLQISADAPKEGYGDAEKKKAVDSLRGTPEADGFLRKFLAYIITV